MVGGTMRMTIYHCICLCPCIPCESVVFCTLKKEFYLAEPEGSSPSTTDRLSLTDTLIYLLTNSLAHYIRHAFSHPLTQLLSSSVLHTDTQAHSLK